MSYQRRAGAPRLIDWTGERCVPWAPDVQVVYEHFHRYLWAAELARGRRVLDLGSGEGFGASILGAVATQVIGVDIDELTVEHSQLNYGASNVKFELGSALDLSAFEDRSFGAVVAFEIIEHVSEQERVLEEITRLLGDDGILVMSTPDRVMYGEARSAPNPFHERELGLNEFLELVGRHFPWVRSWGQRTITGSHIDSLNDSEQGVVSAEAADFFIERAGDEWRLAATPAALYCVAVASRAPLPAMPSSSTLADCGLELMRVQEREAATARLERDELSDSLELENRDLASMLARARSEHARAIRDRDSQIRDARELRQQEIAVTQEAIVRGKQTVAHHEDTIRELADLVAAREAQLASAHQANQRAEESVTWQAFQKARRRLYRAIGGERSLRARALGVSLRRVGRMFVARPAVTSQRSAESSTPLGPDIIRIPTYEDPEVSLIIPLHAHADLTRACLRAILEHTTGARYEVILVDDAADAETKRLLQEVRGARIVHNDENLGYLRSVNKGASVARGKWLVLFNNDTEVRPHWLSALLDCANSSDDVGVVAPKYIYADGTLNEAGGIIWRDGTGVNYGRGDVPTGFHYEYRREIDYGSAAALMVSADLWRKAGGFDERYVPMYYEDVDLCFEARERGLRVLYEPAAVVVHLEGATAGTDVAVGYKRYQEQNRPKFVAKWRRRLDADHHRPSSVDVRIAANRHARKHVLVIDHRVPMWDRDAGSLRILSIMRALIELGARVTFLPDNLADIRPYTAGLQRMGVEVLYGAVDVNAELDTLGPGLSTVILCRPHPASHWLDLVREVAPAAKVIYDTVDLHWLRESRRSNIAATPSAARAATNGKPDVASLSPRAKALRELELAMIRSCDATIVVSDRERIQVERDVPDASLLVLPTVHEVEQRVSSPDDRRGILFVGGFEHLPNVDAAVCLVRQVMPIVWDELGDVQVSIVGSNPPAEVKALASPSVHVEGWVENLEPLLARSRLMLAPLRFGAGMKGKVTQCLAAGLPVVTTPVGAEGLISDDGPGSDPSGSLMLVGEDPPELAAAAIDLYTDDDLWRRLSFNGQAFIAENCSMKVISERLRDLLDDGSAAAASGAVRTA